MFFDREAVSGAKWSARRPGGVNHRAVLVVVLVFVLVVVLLVVLVAVSCGECKSITFYVINFPAVLFLVRDVAKLEGERSFFCPGLFREEGGLS